MQRLFIALELSDRQKHELDSLQIKLKEYLDGVRWVKAQGMHMTLKFLGETEDDRIEQVKMAIDSVTARTGSFQIQFGGCGVFPSPQKARVVWIGLKNGTTEVRELADKLDSALTSSGFEPEKRDYRPHLTLGRLRYPLSLKAIKLFLEQENRFESSPVTVDGIVLFKSQLSRHGAVHTPLHKTFFKR